MCSPAFTDEIRFAHPDHTIAGFDDAAKYLIWKRKQISGNVDGIHKEDYYSHILCTAVDSPCHAVPGKSCVLLRINNVTLERIIQSIKRSRCISSTIPLVSKNYQNTSPLLTCLPLSPSSSSTVREVMLLNVSLVCWTHRSFIWQRLVQVRIYVTDHGPEISAV